MVVRSNAPAQQESPEAVARRRALADAIMGRSSAPQTIGEGFHALGGGIVSGVERHRANEAERAGQASGGAARSSILDLITGGAPGYTPSGGSGGALGAANSVGQSAPTTSSFDGSQQEFIDMLLPAAMAESERTGIDPRIIVAQAAQETGWGKSAPGNNFFGIKSHGQSGGQTLNTHEYINGERVNVADSFRTFGSPEESVRGYGDFITSNPRYGDFMAAQGLDAQLEALQASGYATDPNYSQSVGSIARGIALPQQPQRVASADPSMTLEMTPEMNAAIGAANPADFMDARPNTATAPADPSVLARNLPFRPGQQQGATIPGVTAPTAAAPRPAPTQRPQQVAQGPQYDIRQLMELSSNPWLDEGTRAMVDGIIAQHMQQQDPAYQQDLQQGNIDLQRSQFELDQMMNPGPGPAPMSPQEMAAWGIPEGSGSWAIGDDGYPTQIYEQETPDAPTSVQEYEYYVQQAQAAGQQPVPYVEWDNARKQAGATNVTTNLGDSLSPGWEAIDKAFADTYLSWTGGGSADTRAQLENLGNALSILGQEGGAETGNLVSALPRDAQAFLNPQGLIARENVEETVQRSLRETLGAQFTEREGERLIQRAFNPLLPTSENIRRVNLLVGKIQEMARAKDAMADYFRQNGTLMGYEGLTPTMSDLSSVEQQFGEDPEGDAPAPAPTSNQSQANPGILNAPEVGTVQDGYRFKGGDPSLESNWELAQ